MTDDLTRPTNLEPDDRTPDEGGKYTLPAEGPISIPGLGPTAEAGAAPGTAMTSAPGEVSGEVSVTSDEESPA
jgi:hypothetical protein